MKKNQNVEAFFALLRAGLWEQRVLLLNYGAIDFSTIQELAEEQSVVGLIVAGLEHVEDNKPEKKDVLEFIGQALQLEQQNSSMNYSIGVMVDKMRTQGIYTLLLKGQGVAQCYERPLWRSCGDVDFFLSEDNYIRAKDYLEPLASSVEPEGKYKKHQGMTIDPWVVELHGNLRCGLSTRVDGVLDEVKRDVFYGGNVRSWMNGDTQVFLMGVNNDAIYLFTHFLGHFYKGGIGVRQICDWCRLLWTYRESLDYRLLESRIRKMGLMSEWKAFGAFAVEYLGMPIEAMPLLNENDNQNENLKRKAEQIKDFIMMSGNFGHNRGMSYYSKYPYLVRKTISFGQRVSDVCRHARIFPLDSIKFFLNIMLGGLRDAVRGE